jgi:hypothetical protein
MEQILAAIQQKLDSQFDKTVAAMSANTASTPVQVLGPNGQQAHKMALDPSSVHVNQPLANVLVFYKNRKAIADDVMPIVKVNKQSNTYFKYASDTAFNTAKLDVAGQLGQVSEVSLVPSTDSYNAIGRALREWVPVQTIENADNPIQPLAHSEENLARFLTLAREVRVAGQVFSAANYGTNTSALAGGNRWDTSTSTPVADTFAAIQAIQVNDDLVAVYGEQVWNKLIVNTDVKSYITGRPSTELGATPMMMADDTWAKAFGFKAVRIGRMKNNTANDPATPSYGWVWGKSAAFIHVPTSPGMMVCAFGYTFEFRGFTHRTVFDPIRGIEGAYMIQVSHSHDEKVLDTSGATGYLYTTCVS